MGSDCIKVVETCKTVVRDGVALADATPSGPSDQYHWKMDVDVDVIGMAEMEVD